MKKIIFSIVFLFLGVVLFFWLLNETGLKEIKTTLLRLSGVEGSFLLLLGALCALLGTLRWREILKSKGYWFSLKELYGYYLASFAITYLAPMIAFGGEMFRGYVLNLKDEHSTALNQGMAASFIAGIFEYVFEWLAIFLGLGACFFTTNIYFKNHNLVIFLIVLFLSGGFLAYRIFKKKSLIKLLFNVGEDNRGRMIEKETLAFFRLSNKTFRKAFLISIVKASLRLFQYWLLVQFLGKPVSLLYAVSILGVSVLAMAPPISADVGTHDLGSAILFENLGMGQETGIVFASIVRGINLVLAFGGICFLVKAGFATIQQKLFEAIDKISTIKNSNSQNSDEKSRTG